MDEKKRKRTRIMKTIGRIIKMILVLGIAVGITAALFYMGDSYPAGTEAHSYLETSGNAPGTSPAVQITDIEQGLFIDGPGTEHALVFYPGGKVEYTAYLPLLHRLAADGIDCYLVRMPANLAILGISKAEKIIRYNPYQHWYIGGHSLGGAAAAAFASKHADELEGVILLAAYPYKKLSGDLKVLELYGSRDMILSREKLQEAGRYLPADAVTEEISGANHAQFGDYGPQNGDGEAEISPQEQQEITAEKAEAMMLA